MGDFFRRLGQAIGIFDQDPPPARYSAPPPTATVIYDPYPTETPLEEIFLEKTIPCTSCALTIGSNTATATVTIQRSLGSLSAKDCYRFMQDKQKRDEKKLSDYQLGINLSRGLYSTPDDVAAGYCQELTISDEDLQTLAKGSSTLTEDMIRKKRILPMAVNSGYSANTKAIYTMSVPMDLHFSGVATSIETATNRRLRKEINLPVRVTHMSLLYPAPLRMGGSHPDACLILNDPSQNRGQKVILIVPLVASPSGGESSADFIHKLAEYIAVVRDVDPTVGEYPTTTIQTGSSWKLSNLFSLKATDGAKSLLDQNAGAAEYYRVANGFYVWKPATQYEMTMEKEQARYTGYETIRYRWTPVNTGETDPTYIMLDRPLSIDSLDLIALTRNLPPTTPLDSIHKIPKEESYLFHKPAESPARGPGATIPETSGSCTTDLCRESYINYDSTVDFKRAENQIGILEDVYEGKYDQSLFGGVDVLAQCPGGKCDPFLQNLKQIRMPNHTNVIRIILSVLFLLAIVAGVYVALIATVRNYDEKVSSIGETLGQLAGVFARRAQGVMRPPAPVSTAPTGPSLLSQAASFFRPKPPVAQ
jgi:hypothetical protein